MTTFRILTFGCKVNQCDSQIIRETLTSWGLTESTIAENGSPDACPTNLVVINTCTVTGVADAKFHKALRRIRREYPHALVAVTGCYVNKTPASSNLKGADFVFNPHDFTSLVHVLQRSGLTSHGCLPTICKQSYFAEHTRAFLKIQDGCDCYCTYCIVPIVRPKLWSEDPEKVVAAINNLSSKGYREVVLTGIHLGFYGRESGTKNLATLLALVERQCEIERIRLSSIEINEVSDEILDLVAHSKKFCHHFHLPLQSGDDEILRKMGRRYSSDFYLQRTKEIRSKLSDVGITADLIAGFPGETDQQFERTAELVDKMEFAKIHVFRYSPRPGTKASEMDSPVQPSIISKRARHLITVGGKAAERFKERFLDATVQILVESYSASDGSCAGLTSNYIRVKVLDTSANCANQILSVRLTGIDEKTGLAIGRMIGPVERKED